MREEQERLAREEQEGFAKEEQERVTREEQERLVEILAKQWIDRPKQKKPDKNQLEQEGSKTPRSQNGVRRGLGAKRRERPTTQFAVETLRAAELQELTQEGRSPQPMANVKPRQTKKSSEIPSTVRSLARILQQLIIATQYLPQVRYQIMSLTPKNRFRLLSRSQGLEFSFTYSQAYISADYKTIE